MKKTEAHNYEERKKKDTWMWLYKNASWLRLSIKQGGTNNYLWSKSNPLKKGEFWSKPGCTYKPIGHQGWRTQGYWTHIRMGKGRVEGYIISYSYSIYLSVYYKSKTMLISIYLKMIHVSLHIYINHWIGCLKHAYASHLAFSRVSLMN